jgi:hypothetical protein
MSSRCHETKYVGPQGEYVLREREVADAGRRLTGPAIGLMVCSLLGLLNCFGFEVWVFIFNGDNMSRKLVSQPITCALVIAVPGLIAAIYAAMLFGSVQMLRRKSYKWAKAASILALIPSSVLVILSIGFGIWGLVVLRDKDVKAAFG